MAYYLTPADRRARTQVMRMQRDPAYRRQKEKEEEERLEAARAASVQSTAAPSAVSEPEEEGNFFTKVLHTIGDVAANVVTGAGKGIEGIVDLGAGIGGAVAGVFSDDAENAVKDFIAKDHTGELYGNAWQEALDQSALNNSKVGQIIESVAQGVGQMLPAVAVTALTGAAFAPAALRAASTSLGLGTTIASAAGTGTEEAFQDGADYGKGLTYGAVSGAIEGVTEKMTGGVTKKVIGPGLLDNVIGKVAKTGAARVAADAIGEGVEEMTSEVLGQGAKAIYKGKDAFKEYGEADFWKSVGEAGIVGAGTSVAYGGTVGKVMRTSGVYADANNVLEHIDEQENRIAKGDLSAEQEVKARESIKKDYKLLETRLAKAKPAVRERVLKNPTLAAAFDADGTLKQDFVARMDADAAAAADTTYDRAYRSSTLSAAEIDGVVQKANGGADAVQNAKGGADGDAKSGTVRAFTGQLTEAQSKKNAELRNLMGVIGQRSGGKVKYFLAENTGENGFIDVGNGIIGIDVNTLESGKAVEQLLKGEIAAELWQKTAIHETEHATKKTVSHALFAQHIKGNDTVYNKAVDDFIARGYFGTDVDAARARFDALVEKLNSGETLTETEDADLGKAQSEIAAIAAENVLGNADFIRRLVKGEPSRAEKILGKIVQIKNALTGNSEANAQAAFIRKAEKLYLDAIAELGGTYRDGKIHIANREEDEDARTAAEDAQFSAENTTESVDESGELRYNKKDNYTALRGWAEGVLSEEDRRLLRGKISEAEASGFEAHPQLSDGSYLFDVNNKIVFVSGDFDMPVYEAVVDINTDNATTASKIRKDIEDATYGKRYSCAAFLEIAEDYYGEEILTVYRREDWTGSSADAQGRYPTRPDGYKDFGYSSEQRYGRRSAGEAENSVTQKRPSIKPVSQTFTDVTGKERIVLGAGEGRYMVDGSIKNRNFVFDSAEAAIAAENKAIVASLARKHNRTPSWVAARLNEDPKFFESAILFSRTVKTDGQVAKDHADRNYGKIYTKKDAREIISAALTEHLTFPEDGVFGNLVGKSRDQAIEVLWKGLNSAEEGKRAGLALDMADFIIENAVAEDLYDDGDNTEQLERLKILRGYMHKLDLSAIKAEIEYKHGKKNSAALVWGARKNTRGIAVDVAAMELAERGIALKGDNPADQFFAIQDAYRSAAESIKKQSATRLAATMSEEERAALRQDIAKEILRGFDNTGEASKLSKAINFYEERLRALREEIKDLRSTNGLTNSVLDKAQKLRDLKYGAYLNASKYKESIFRGSVEKLASIKYRGNLREAAVRDVVKELASWYNSDNPLYKGGEDGDALKMNAEILEWMKAITDGEGRLTTDELQALGKIIDFFVHEVENFRKVRRNGKWEDALPIAKDHVENVRRVRSMRGGWLSRLAQSAYMRLVSDPLSLMRRADGYRHGFFTEAFENLRRGAITAGVTKQEMLSQYEQFFEKYKGYKTHFFKDCVTYRGQVLTVRDAISLYMTMHREQAWAGLAVAGFQVDAVNSDKADTSKLKTERVPGFAENEPLTREELEKRIKNEQRALRKQFTDEDLAFIKVVEEIYRQCGELKKATDMEKQGYTNLTESYYYPIRRAQTADTIEKPLDEISRVSGLSFNKDTVKGARGELLIEPVDAVLRRHVDGISIYAGLAVETDNINRLFNLNITENKHKPTTVKSEIATSTDFVKEMWKYVKQLQSDVEGVPRDQKLPFYHGAVRFIRSGYAKFQLGANPKVWVTQLSSLIAATNVLDTTSIVSGLKIKTEDVDKYCRLAWLRNVDNQAVKAESVTDQVGKVGDVLMKPIGWFDRGVVKRLFAACQVQVEKDGGAKIGTEQNKIDAGKLLEQVILDTQQNSLATERSAAMRSPDELLKGFTMFSADAMKGFGRFVDAIGEVGVLKDELRTEKDPAKRKELEARMKEAKKQLHKSTAALVGVAFFSALIARGFKWAYDKDDEESAGTFMADFFGNALGGLPFVRDIYGFFQDGFEMDNFLIGTVNDVMKTALDTFNLAVDAASGKEVTSHEVTTAGRKLLYAAGQLAGIPTRNMYNVSAGFLRRISPEAGYTVDSWFTTKYYSSDLKKAMEAGDDEMVARIASLMIDERGVEDEGVQEVLRELIGKGYSVLPRSVGDSITVDGEKVALSGKQQKRFREFYRIGDDAVADMVKLKQFAEADDEVQAKAIQFVNDVYWELAVSDLTGEDLAEKNVLFAEAIPIEKLAIIIATARSFESDKDRNGKTIAGTKKRKVQTFVNSLRLTAAQKYMVMGYLGYSNINGEQQVKSYIGRLSLNKTEQAALMKYSGYAE